MVDLAEALRGTVPDEHLLVGDAVNEDYAHDEALTATPVLPAAVLRPGSTTEVAAILAVADAHRIPVTARGSGTGLSGACTPVDGGIVVSFERMTQVLEIDTENHMAVVQPGLTLAELDEQLAAHDLVYPVFPGEYSASLGGNVNTNAGGMRAVKYGVTRHHVIGLEVVLASGEVIRTGGKVVKATAGYDLTQLVLGSEGTLGLVTEATLKLYPRQHHAATVLVPFATLEGVAGAVPKIVASGVGPLILEYIDLLTMAVITASAGLDLGIPEHVKETALAYLVVVIEGTQEDRVEADVAQVAELVTELGAEDVYVLPSHAGAQLIEAREKAFWAAKANDADDIIDVVVPRASMPEYLAAVAELAAQYEAWVPGCGHAGDGNVHLSVFQKDPEKRDAILRGIVSAGLALGGAISGEHGLGTEKKKYFLEFEDPVKVELMRRIKAGFDPNGILNPGKVF